MDLSTIFRHQQMKQISMKKLRFNRIIRNRGGYTFVYLFPIVIVSWKIKGRAITARSEKKETITTIFLFFLRRYIQSFHEQHYWCVRLFDLYQQWYTVILILSYSSYEKKWQLPFLRGPSFMQVKRYHVQYLLPTHINNNHHRCIQMDSLIVISTQELNPIHRLIWLAIMQNQHCER